MKKLLLIIPLLLLCFSCKKEKTEVSDYSDVREAPYLYKDPLSDEYVTFERYMWNGGFPDTIIIEFTVDDKFQSYQKAVRHGVLEDSLGNCYSPAYVIMGHNADNWVYNVKGELVEFNECHFNDPENDPYVPYNP